MLTEEEIKITVWPSIIPDVCNITLSAPVFPDQTFNFADKESAKGSPVLEALFREPWLKEVLATHDTLVIKKNGTENWQELGIKIGEIIRANLNQDFLLFPDGFSPPISQAQETEEVFPENVNQDDPEFQAVKKIIEEQINPSVASHGGAITLLNVKNHIVTIKMSGGCQGCSSALATLKQGVERAIKENVPSIQSVEDITDHASGVNPYFN